MQTITISTPSEELIVSQNGAAQNQPQQSSSEFDKLLKANTTLTVWLIFLVIGGGLLARYYIKIGYLPDMEWNAALIYLFVCSVWGGVFGLLLTMSFYLPGVIWCDTIIFEPFLDDHLTFEAEHDEPSGKRSRHKEPCIQSIMMWLGAPFFLALVSSHLLLRKSDKSVYDRIDFYWIWAGLVLAGTFLLVQVIFRLLLKRKKITEGKTFGRQIFKYSFWFTISVLLNQISMYVIYRLADRTPNDDDFHILTVLCTLGVLIATHVVAVRHRSYPRQALIAALVTAVVLLFVADRFSDLAMKLMNRYGVGEGKEVIVVVNEKGSKTLKDLGFAEGTWRLDKVNILSKMGDHYFVKMGNHSFTIPKSDVESLHRYDEPNPTTR
jgi:hypothetical protein